MKVGDPSSKYAYGRSLDEDIEDKIKKYEEAKVDLIAYLDIFLKDAIFYNDGLPMSVAVKLDIIRESFKSILIQEGEINV